MTLTSNEAEFWIAHERIKAKLDNEKPPIATKFQPYMPPIIERHKIKEIA
jgi:hypothetical protein